MPIYSTAPRKNSTKAIAVSLKGPYLVTKYVATQMKNQGRGGKIVNFGSTSGMVGRPDGIAYAAAKAGVINMTRAMAVQLSPYKIRVNCIVPNRSGSPVGYDDHVTGSRTFDNLAGIGSVRPKTKPRRRFFWSARIQTLFGATRWWWTAALWRQLIFPKSNFRNSSRSNPWSVQILQAVPGRQSQRYSGSLATR